jgi:hypothetical protein
MAHQTTSIRTSNPKNQPISWPDPEENMARVLPASEDRIFRSSLSAAERSLQATQRKISDAATSLAHSVRRFADERPLHFVGVIAGVGLVAGVALRIWRSKDE